MQAHPETAFTFIGSVVFWAVLVAAFYLPGKRPGWASRFREQMDRQRQAALVVAAICLAAGILGSKLDPGKLLGSLLISALTFCQALIGLAVASGIAGFEPLPVAKALVSTEPVLRPAALAAGAGAAGGTGGTGGTGAAVAHRSVAWRSLALMLLFGVTGAIIGLVVASIGQGIIESIVHETSYASDAARLTASDKVFSFFSFLQGAGFAEETPYRLVILSLVWRLAGDARDRNRGRRLAIWASAIAFAGYHFTPLDSIYYVFWQYPISHFIATVLIGLVWGFIFTRRGYETTVLAHTMSDWIAVVVFL